jgi:hypothetical protein
MKRVYFLTSCHYNPVCPDSEPLCLVWIGLETNYNITASRVYKSYNLPKMLSLARQMAQDRNLPLTVLSVDTEVVEVYSRDRAPP